MNLDKDKFGDLNNSIGHICISTRDEILNTSGSFIVSPTEKDYDVYMYFIRDAIMEKQKAIEDSIKRFQYKYPTLCEQPVNNHQQHWMHTRVGNAETEFRSQPCEQRMELEKQLVIIQTFKDKIPKRLFA
jgi:hypothetical protein